MLSLASLSRGRLFATAFALVLSVVLAHAARAQGQASDIRVFSGQTPITNGFQLSLGDVAVGDTTGVSQALTVRNFGNIPLLIDSTLIAGTHAADFSVSRSGSYIPPLSDNPPPPITVTVTFKPSAAGLRSATLSIASNDPAKAVIQITLTGTGTGGDNPPPGPATNVITFAAPAPRQYGDAPFDLEATASSGLPVSFSVSGPATLGGADRKKLTLTGAGTIRISATQRGGVRDGVTYPAARVVKQTLVVTKAPLTLTVADARKLRGQALPAPVIAYEGFIGSDTAARLGSPPTRSTTATSASPAGTYPFTVSGGTDPNYTFTIVPATLRVIDYSGDYEVLLLATDASDLPAAKLSLRVATSHSFTGKLEDGAEGAILTIKAPSGGLALDPASDDAIATATILVRPLGRTAFTYNLPLRFSALSPAAPLSARLQIGGTLKAKGENGRLVFTKNKIHTASKLTLVLAPPELLDPETPGPLPVPGGHGHATGTFNTTGKLTLSGTLADGSKLTASLSPDAAGRYRLFALPYSKRPGSYLAGRIEPIAHPDLPAGHRHVPAASGLDLYWAKTAAPKDKAFRAGFGASPLLVAFTLDPWLPPSKAAPVSTLAQRLDLNPAGTFLPVFTAEDFDTSGANPYQLPTALRLDSRDKILVTAPAAAIAAKPSLKFDAATGVFAGKFTLRQTLGGQTAKRTLKIVGVLRQPPSTEEASAVFGAGCFELSPLPKTNETRFDAFQFEHAVTHNPLAEGLWHEARVAADESAPGAQIGDEVRRPAGKKIPGPGEGLREVLGPPARVVRVGPGYAQQSAPAEFEQRRRRGEQEPDHARIHQRVGEAAVVGADVVEPGKLGGLEFDVFKAARGREFVMKTFRAHAQRGQQRPEGQGDEQVAEAAGAVGGIFSRPGGDLVAVIPRLDGKLGTETAEASRQPVMRVVGVAAVELVELRIKEVETLVFFLPEKAPAQPLREPAQRDEAGVGFGTTRGTEREDAEGEDEEGCEKGEDFGHGRRKRDWKLLPGGFAINANPIRADE